MTTVQVLVEPLQSPPQALNTYPAAGWAVSVTEERAAKVAEHLVPGQLMPAGLDVTEPLPFILTEIGLAKSAEAAVYALTVTVQAVSLSCAGA